MNLWFQVLVWPLGFWDSRVLLGFWDSYYGVASSAAEIFCRDYGLGYEAQGVRVQLVAVRQALRSFSGM